MCLFLLLEICQLNKEQDIVWIRLSWKLYVRDTLYGVISIFLTFQKQTQTLIIMRTNSTKSLFAVKDCNAFLKSYYMLKEQFFLGLVQSCTKLLLVPSIWKIILEKSFCISFCYFFQREKNINELWSSCCSELFLSSFTDEFIKQNSTRNKCYYEISRMNARVQILNIFF